MHCLNRPLVLLLITALALPVPGLPAQEINLPDLGSSSSSAISPREEYRIGRDITRQMRQAGFLVDDPLLTEYMNSIGHRLAAASQGHGHGQQFEFFLVRDDSLNAFALPGGFIGVNAGLLLTTDTESELAGVMAHEVAHVTQRHIARQLEAANGMGWAAAAAVLGAILIGASDAGGEATQAAIMATQAGLMQQRINFTRAHEAEADRVGIGILAAADFNVTGMANFFRKLQEKYRFLNAALPEYLSTHPLSISRIVEAQQRAQDYKDGEYHESRLYPLMKARLRVLRSKNPQQTLTYFETRTPTDSLAAQVRDYGRALSHLALHQPDKAQILFVSLVEQAPDVTAFHIGLADAAAAASDNDTAIATYTRAKKLFPGNRPLALSFIHFLLHQNRPQEAEQEIMKLLASGSPDADLYRLLAEASQQQQRTAEMHFYLAEYYAQQSIFPEAAAQIQLALAQPELSTTQKTRYEARRQVLQEKLAEQRRHEHRKSKLVP